ncbi:hypothetical protein CONCODRAFT_14278, partial [Conidiobolus coronatus NRRL 28638]
MVFITLEFLNFHAVKNRINKLNSKSNLTKNSYTSNGYINCLTILGGFNNQLEQFWFLSILAQKTRRGLVEPRIKLIDQPNAPKYNLSEIINRPKYFSNLPIIQQEDYINHCGPYIKTIKLPSLNWYEIDQLQHVIDLINNEPEYICINIDFVPSYEFFGSNSFKNWIPSFKELVLPNFEFLKLIKDQADDFLISNNLENIDYLSVQLRRGDYLDHCKSLFSHQAGNWAFGMIYDDRFSDFDRSKWEEFEKHCYPSISSFVNRITDFKLSKSSNITKTLILTNVNNTEIAELKQEFNINGLELIRFSPKLELIPSNIKWNITHSLAVEMELARRG